MAGEGRAAASPLIQGLADKPYKFHFYQAARLLECSQPQHPRLGRSQRPAEDPVRFAQEASLAFAPAALKAYQPASEGIPSRLTVSFFGLLGPNGPLPLHLTEYARDRIKHHADETFSRFLDVFHHRMLSLLYRAWACHQQAVSYDRPKDDRFAHYVGGVFGIGMSSFEKRDPVPDVAKRHYAGRLGCPTRNAEGLGAIISDYFKVKVQIEQFVGHWVHLPDDAVFKLGRSAWTGTLGTTAVLGSKVWDCQQKFTIKLGPLHYKAYRRLLPGTDSFRRLVAWVRNYVGDELSWDVHLVLMGGEVPKMCLGRLGDLGWSSWLAAKPIDQNVVSIVSNPLTSYDAPVAHGDSHG